MSLSNLLQLSENREGKKLGLSEERVTAILDPARVLIAFYRKYPDLLIDKMVGPNGTFKFYTYQRVFLRQVMRYRYTYAVYPRAFSKSFLSMLALMLKCILYPNSKLFVTTGGKEQAASITVSKIQEICSLIPALNNELDWSRGASKHSKDDVRYIFKNGSSIDILAARPSSRGQRRTAGLMEECVLIDGDVLNEVIIPVTNIDRLLPDGSRHREEIVNQSQTYITTAGYKNSFAYQKLIEMLIQSMIDPDEVCIMGGTYEVPVKEGLLPEDFVDQLRLSGTFNDESFDREYRSIWSGDAENAFFSVEKFEKMRVLNQPEYEFSGRSSKDAYYVLGVDLGRKNDSSEVVIIKVTPQTVGTPIKSIVNLYSFEDMPFDEQAIRIRRLYYTYKARAIAIDGNGIGINMLDFLMRPQDDPDTGEHYPGFGVINDDEKYYKKFYTNETIFEVLYVIKANAPLNTEAHSYVQAQLSTGRLRFLIDESQAKSKLMDTKMGQTMTTLKRADYLRPFTATTILKEQMANLVESNEGINIILKQSSRHIKKDKFSALEYGLYYIKKEEEKGRRAKNRDISKMLLFTSK